MTTTLVSGRTLASRSQRVKVYHGIEQRSPGDNAHIRKEVPPPPPSRSPHPHPPHRTPRAPAFASSPPCSLLHPHTTSYRALSLSLPPPPRPPLVTHLVYRRRTVALAGTLQTTTTTAAAVETHALQSGARLATRPSLTGRERIDGEVM